VAGLDALEQLLEGQLQQTDNANKGTDNGNKGTDNANKGTDNGNKGTDNGNKGAGLDALEQLLEGQLQQLSLALGDDVFKRMLRVCWQVPELVLGAFRMLHASFTQACVWHRLRIFASRGVCCMRSRGMVDGLFGLPVACGVLYLRGS
jgi:hypothetical protein